MVFRILKKMTILVTGAAGFVGSNFILDWLEQFNEPVINLSLLTYTGNLENLKELKGDPRHKFVRGNIGDRNLDANLLADAIPASTRQRVCTLLQTRIMSVAYLPSFTRSRCCSCRMTRRWPKVWIWTNLVT